jgi:hypothetical protein
MRTIWRDNNGLEQSQLLHAGREPTDIAHLSAVSFADPNFR